jgi:hypothetical protein
MCEVQGDPRKSENTHILSSLGEFFKASDFGGQAPKSPVGHGVFRLNLAPSLKPKTRVILTRYQFTQASNQDSPHYPLIVNNAG